MRKTIAFVAALFFGSAVGGLWAGDDPNQATFDRKKAEPSSDGSIDKEFLKGLIDRLDSARTRGDLRALRAVDAELKKWIGSVVRANRSHTRSESTSGERPKSTKAKSTKLDPPARQVLFLTAFELRRLYGKSDRVELSEKRRLLVRLTQL